MSEETVNDANAPDVMDDRAEISSIPDSLLSSPDATAKAVSTIEPPEENEEPKGEAAPAVNEGEAGEVEGEEPQGGQDSRYDKDPAWQRILSERNDARAEIAAMKAQLDLLTKIVPTQPQAAQVPEQLPFKDLTKMSPEEIREWMEDDPLGYEANRFAQFHYESEKLLEQKLQKQSQEQAQKEAQEKVDRTYKDYGEKNPDFNKLWESGEIKKFMDSNPGHTALSAHMAMTMEARIDAAVKEAVKAAEEKVIKNFQAKKNAAVLSEGPAHRGGQKDGTPVELKNTKQHGGLTAVLASRLAARRAGAQP